MCYLNMVENKYNSSRAFWKALIVNQKYFFTIDDILQIKNNPSKEDLLLIQDVIKELGELQVIKRIGKRFYILDNMLMNT